MEPKPFKSLYDHLRETEPEQLQPAPLSKTPDELGFGQLTPLSPTLIAGLASLGEELVNAAASPAPLSSEPGAGPRVLGGCPGRVLTALAEKQARKVGKIGWTVVNAKRTPEERRRIAMLGVAARKRKKETQ